MFKLFAFLFAVLFSILFFGSLVRVILYERAINKLHDERDAKIEIEKQRCVSMGIIERRIDSVTKSYQQKIDVLERKRRFLLDKLPFLRR